VLLTLIAISVVLALSALRLRSRPKPALSRASAAIQNYNFAALTSLLDKKEFIFLREQLPFFEVWHLHANRMRVAIGYLRDLDVHIRDFGDALVGAEAEDAKRLTDQLPQIRLIILLLQLRAIVSIVVPGTHAPAERLHDMQCNLLALMTGAAETRHAARNG
jgi:hypothetical protein